MLRPCFRRCRILEEVSGRPTREIAAMYETLLLHISGKLATLTLNRPDKRNAISAAMISELQSALDAMEKSHARVGILTGSGKSFSAGMDLEMLAALAKQSPTDRQST